VPFWRIERSTALGINCDAVESGSGGFKKAGVEFCNSKGWQENAP
jgi:hypothetical protein